jgi:molybdopterin-binding protein
MELSPSPAAPARHPRGGPDHTPPMPSPRPSMLTRAQPGRNRHRLDGRPDRGSEYPGRAPDWSFAHAAAASRMHTDELPIDDLVQIGAAAAALGVSIDTLRRWERAGRIRFERRGNRRYISSHELADRLRERGATSRSSARNRLQGTVLAVQKDGLMAQIDMACGPYRIVSLMSREAADELDLKPGDQATAIVKSTTVIVESR